MSLSSSRLAAVVSVLLVLSSGCSADSKQDAPASVSVASPAAGSVDLQGARLLVRFDDQLVGVRLEANPAAQQLVAALPLELTLTDPVGQAKSAPLPRPLDVVGVERVDDPETGGFYYSRHGMVAFVYDDLGQTVPDPGLVRLGTVDPGLQALVDADNRVTVHLEFAA